MPILTVDIKNKIATADNVKIVCENSDYTVNFIFDDEWEKEAAKTMRVKYDGQYIDVVFSGTSAPLPIISNTLGIEIGVYCGDLKTTTPAVYDCIKSIRCGTNTPAPPSNTVYDEIMKLLNDVIKVNAGIKSIVFKATDEQGNYIYTVTLNNDVTYEITCPKGAKGDAPVKGVDYWTNQDKAEIINEVGQRIDIVESKIPEQASETNQLADKAFVNSSISTNTAYYISNNGQPFNSIAELTAYQGQITNNDYAFVKGTDGENVYYDRYKYNANNKTWSKEYRLNNSSFTAEQWEAINSNITAALVSQISKNESDISDLQLAKIGPSDYATESTGGTIKWWTGTQAEYEAIETKDSNTLYMIVEGEA